MLKCRGAGTSQATAEDCAKPMRMPTSIRTIPILQVSKQPEGMHGSRHVMAAALAPAVRQREGVVNEPPYNTSSFPIGQIALLPNS